MIDVPDPAGLPGATPVTTFARALLAASTPEDVLRTTADLAAAHVGGAVVVTVLGRDRAGDVAETLSSSTVALAAERVQQECGEGPTWDARAGEDPLCVTDLATDSTARQRWPVFAREALESGITGFVVCGLGGYRGRRAVLSVYATAPVPLREETMYRARLLAEHAALVLRQAQRVALLRTALHSRQQIGEATGIIIERHRVDSRSAFDLLAKASQRTNVKLRLLAEHVVLTGQDPAHITAHDVPRPANPGTPAANAADDDAPRPKSQLRITSTSQNGCQVLHVAGEIDLATSPELDAALRRAQTAGTPLVADLTQVEFCDASGLRALLTANARDGSLRVVPSRIVARVIDLAGTARVLALYPNRTQALADGTATP